MAKNISNFGDAEYVDKPKYLILRPDKATKLDLFGYLVKPYSKSHRFSFLDTSDVQVTRPRSLLERFYTFICIILPYLAKPLEHIGYVAKFISNLLSHIGNLFSLPRNLFFGNVDRAYQKSQYSMKEIVDSSSKQTGIKLRRPLMYLCVKASELAYQKEEEVRKMVEEHWQMHFVSFHNGWNDYLERWSTQVFILCDKPKDAKLILISFRGTETFDLDDWLVNLDISWYEIADSVCLHVGFLEALGLGNRKKMNFKTSLMLTKETNFDSNNELARAVAMTEKSAYYKVKSELMNLLKEHKNAKFVVTGHSQGGALAIMLPIILVVNEEIDIMNRFLGVYTFGQPRIGNKNLGEFMKDHLNLNTPAAKYFRLVYGNDIVARIPWDNKCLPFGNYKHFGVCLYHDSCYTEHETNEVPNPNLLGLPVLILMYINGFWELIRSFIICCMHGPEYKEGFSQIMRRIIPGLIAPFISAHGFTDYVNSVKLGGKKRLLRM